MKTKGFKLFLGAVFLNAFIDLGHKMTVQNTLFKLYDGAEQVFHTSIVNSLILWPYIFLFSVSSFISDKNPRHSVMRVTSILSIIATVLITYCYWQGAFWWAYGLTLLMAVQSAIYGPAKYGYIRDLLGRANVAQGNGAAHSLTIIAILMATVGFSAIYEMLYLDTAASAEEAVKLMVPIGVLLVLLAIVEALCIWQLPAMTQPNNISFNIRDWLTLKLFQQNIRPVKDTPIIWGAILGLTAFWCVGQIALAAWPAHMKMVTQIDNALWVQATMGASGIGIGVGAFAAGRLSRGYIEWGWAPIALIIAMMMLWLLPFSTSAALMALWFLLFGIAGGVFIVPLNSLLQFNASDTRVGLVLAGNNWVQNIAMVACLMVAAGASLFKVPPLVLLVFAALIMTVMGALTIRRFPAMSARWRQSENWFIRLRVEGLNLLPHAGFILVGSDEDFDVVQMATPRTLLKFDSAKRALAACEQGEAVYCTDTVDNRDEKFDVRVSRLSGRYKAVVFL